MDHILYQFQSAHNVSCLLWSSFTTLGELGLVREKLAVNLLEIKFDFSLLSADNKHSSCVSNAFDQRK